MWMINGFPLIWENHLTWLDVKWQLLFQAIYFYPFEKIVFFIFTPFWEHFLKHWKVDFLWKQFFSSSIKDRLCKNSRAFITQVIAYMLLKMTLKHVHCNIFRVWNRFILPMRDYYFRDAFEASSIFRADGTVGNFFFENLIKTIRTN